MPTEPWLLLQCGWFAAGGVLACILYVLLLLPETVTPQARRQVSPATCTRPIQPPARELLVRGCAGRALLQQQLLGGHPQHLPQAAAGWGGPVCAQALQRQLTRRRQQGLKPWKGFNGLDILLRNPLFMKLTVVLMLNGIVSEGLWEVRPRPTGLGLLACLRSALALGGSDAGACAADHDAVPAAAPGLRHAGQRAHAPCLHAHGCPGLPGAAAGHCWSRPGTRLLLWASVCWPLLRRAGLTDLWPQSHLFSLAGMVGLVNNTAGMRILVGVLGETNMMRFGITVYAIEMVRRPPAWGGQPSCGETSWLQQCQAWVAFGSDRTHACPPRRPVSLAAPDAPPDCRPCWRS